MYEILYSKMGVKSNRQASKVFATKKLFNAYFKLFSVGAIFIRDRRPNISSYCSCFEVSNSLCLLCYLHENQEYCQLYRRDEERRTKYLFSVFRKQYADSGNDKDLHLG